MVDSEPTLDGRHGPILQGTWWRMGACLAPCLDLKLVCRGARSVGYRQWPQAHLRRGYEPTGGANFLVSRSVILNFLLGSYLSRSLAAQGPRKISLKNVLLIVTPWEALLEVWKRLPLSCRTSTVGPPGRRCQGSGSAHHQHKKRRRRAPWEAVSEVWECPPSTRKTLIACP
jgi:hypothetical protein